MFCKNLLVLFFAFCITNSMAQTKNFEWQVGVGAGVTKFSDEDAIFIGDRYQFQIPRLNVTKPISKHLAFDIAFSANTFDIGYISNDANYLSIDSSLRYFFDIADIFFPYVFVGGSLAQAEFNLAPAFNFGAGGTIWVNDILGFNAQAYYKVPFNSDNMRSHIQVTAGMVFALDLYDLLFNGSKGSGFCR